MVEWRAVDDTIHALADEMQRRQDAGGSGHPDQAASPSIYICIYGLQRYRSLRKSEDSAGFSFSMNPDDEAAVKRAPVDKRFAELPLILCADDRGIVQS